MPEAHRPVGRRIVVVGTSGSGKTTLARQLAVRLGFPHIEADALHWEQGWRAAPLPVFRARVDQATAGNCWTYDGNYSKVREIAWGRADTLAWLDYPLPVILWRLLRRTLRRTVGGEVLWNGNRESFWEQFFTRDSLFYWALTTYRRHRREYPVLFQQPEYAHLTVIHLRSPRETATWLASLEAWSDSVVDSGSDTD